MNRMDPAINQTLLDSLLQKPTRRSVLYGLGGVAASAMLSGCGSNSTLAGVAFPNTASAVQPTPSGVLTAATVTVGAATGYSVGSNFAGLSYEKSMMCVPMFSGSNSGMIGLFNRLGNNLLRIGGISADNTLWTAGGAGLTAGQIAPSDIDALAAFLKATGWTVLYGVNLETSTPQLAADEVAYAVSALGSSLYGIEIGNEPDGYGGQGYLQGWNLQVFEQRWSQFRAAIVAKSPNVLITGPSDGQSVSTWTVPFAQTEGKTNLSLITQHYYRGDGKASTSTLANLISYPDTLLTGTYLTPLRTCALGLGLPFRITETNSYYSGGVQAVSNSFASALWVLDHLFTLAQNGAAGANFHGGNGGAYTAIADSGGIPYQARPLYYGMMLFNMAGLGSLLSTTVSTAASGINVTAYAIKNSTGGLSVIVNNKDSINSLAVTVNCGQSTTSAKAVQLVASGEGPVLNALSNVELQGGQVDQFGNYSPNPPFAVTASGSQVTCYVPAASAVLIQIT